MSSSSSSSSSSSWSSTDDDDSPLRLTRRRSALFHLGVARFSSKEPDPLESVPERFYVQIRYCNNGSVLSTELTLVSGNRPLSEALLQPSRTDPFSIYLDSGALHQPFRPLKQLLRAQDVNLTIANAVKKWNCFKFVVDYDASGPQVFTESQPDETPAPQPALERFYTINELPVIDLSNDPRPSPNDRRDASVVQEPQFDLDQGRPLRAESPQTNPSNATTVQLLPPSSRPQPSLKSSAISPSARPSSTSQSSTWTPSSRPVPTMQLSTTTPSSRSYSPPQSFQLPSSSRPPPTSQTLATLSSSPSHPPPQPATPPSSSRPRMFAKAPSYLVNKRRESLEKVEEPSTSTLRPEGQKPSLLTPSPKVKRLSLDVADVHSFEPGNKNVIASIVTPRAKRCIDVSSQSSPSNASTTSPQPLHDDNAQVRTPAAKSRLATPITDSKPLSQEVQSQLTPAAAKKKQPGSTKRSTPKSVVARTLRVSLTKEAVPGFIYNSVVAAAKDARSGDQIIVSSGVYRERSTVELLENVTLSAANDVDVKDVVIVGRSVSFSTLGIRGDNVAVRGLTIRKNRSKSSNCYPAIIDTDAKIQNFLLIDCCIDGGFDRMTMDKFSKFQGVFFDIETSGRIENCSIENIPDHAIVANPDGIVHVSGGCIRRILFSAVRIAKRSVKKGQEPPGVCVFLNNVVIEDVEEKVFDADPGQISINGSITTSA